MSRADATTVAGRRVTYAEHGDPAGRAVFLLHGTPGCRLGHAFAHEPAAQRGIRIVCPDRPGIGGADPAPGRTIAGYAGDVLGLADALGIDRFTVLGYSGGGPYALACAAGCGPRLTSTGLMAGVGPLDRPGARDGLAPSDAQMFEMVEHRPAAARRQMRLVALAARLSPALVRRSFAGELSEPDRAALATQDPRELANALREAMAQGPGGVIEDYRLLVSPWRLDWPAVTAPVHLFQGDADQMVPMRHAETVHDLLPAGMATLHPLPGVGHVSIQNHIGTILDELP